MIGFLDVRHIRHLLAHERHSARSHVGAQDGRVREAPAPPVARPGPTARDELAAFGLCDVVSADGPASLRTVNQVSNREALETFALLRTETRKPSRPASLAEASPYDFLLYLGLMG
jgi:hypothetical protein